MDERNIRTERTDLTTDQAPDVDIRRSMIMGRDLNAYGAQNLIVAAPMERTVHWGPIWAGLVTTLVTTTLFGALFVGVGFSRSAGYFGGLTPSSVGWGTVIASLIGVFIGAYLTGYVSNIRTKAEGVYNGLMVGMMTILTPVLLSVFGAFNLVNAAANTLPRTSAPGATAGNVAANVPASTQAQVSNALVVAADNAWAVFVGGVIILGLAALAGYLGRKSREAAIAADARAELDLADTRPVSRV